MSARPPDYIALAATLVGPATDERRCSVCDSTPPHDDAGVVDHAIYSVALRARAADGTDAEIVAQLCLGCATHWILMQADEA